MKYQYCLPNGNILAESDSPIQFNAKLFPVFAEIKAEVKSTGRKFNTTSYKKDDEEEN